MIVNHIQGTALLIVSLDDKNKLNFQFGELCRDYKIEPIFYIPAIEMDHIKELDDQGYQIGCHSFSHPSDLKIVTESELYRETKIAKEAIEAETGKPCEDYCYPRGRHNDTVVQAVKEAGFKTARTTLVLKTDYPEPLRMPTTIHMYSGRKEYKGRDWLTMAKFYWDHSSRHGDVFHLWGHAAELERDKQWDRVRKFFDYITKNEVSD